MHKPSVICFIAGIHCIPSVFAQAPAAKNAVPPAKTEPAPVAGPTRASVEKYVTELKAVITLREVSATRMVNEIVALDKSIQESVNHLLQILTTSKDSLDTKTRVAQMKQETVAALKRAVQAYGQKRGLIAEELRTTKNEYRQEDLFKSRGQIDQRIDKMVDTMVQLALSMETDEGHERYVQDSGIMVGGRWGIAVPTTSRNPEYDQNKKQTARTDKVTTELDKAFQASLQRLDTQERDLVSKLAVPNLSEEQKTRLTAEVERVRSMREERVQQQTMLEEGYNPVLQSEVGKKDFAETEEIVDTIMAGGRRDFTRMMAVFNELRAERQALAHLKSRLDFSANWLETNKGVR